MTRVLVVWEDAYYESLGELVKRAVHARGAPGAAASPVVVPHTSRGNGGFSRYVRATWPNARARGTPLDARPIDHLVCVVDADRLHELEGVGAKPRPAAVTATDAWHDEAQRAWQVWLRAQCAPDGPPATTVHGLVLRWAKESVLLAGFDQPAWARSLDIDTSTPPVQAELRRQCNPHPSETPDVSFTNTFRRPLHCLQFMRQAGKLNRLDKNDVTIDDAVSALARESLPTILARVPDLARLASLIWSLQQGVPEPELEPVAPKSREPIKKAQSTERKIPRKRKRS